jgi:hypothetical protein
MTRRLRAGLALDGVFAVLLAVGCGGGGGGDRLSTDEFRQRANAICERYDAKIAAIGSPSSPEDIPQFVEKGIPLIEQGLAELRALNPPEQFEEDYDRMLDVTEKAIPAAHKLADAAAKQDAEAVQAALRAGEAADEESDRIATKLGLDRCAAGSS